MPSKNPHDNHNVVPISTIGRSEQASPISEGVAEILRSPCNGNNLTTRHTWATEAT
jgi:hypothetical protein